MASRIHHLRGVIQNVIPLSFRLLYTQQRSNTIGDHPGLLCCRIPKRNTDPLFGRQRPLQLCGEVLSVTPLGPAKNHQSAVGFPIQTKFLSKTVDWNPCRPATGRKMIRRTLGRLLPVSQSAQPLLVVVRRAELFGLEPSIAHQTGRIEHSTWSLCNSPKSQTNDGQPNGRQFPHGVT